MLVCLLRLERRAGFPANSPLLGARVVAPPLPGDAGLPPGGTNLPLDKAFESRPFAPLVLGPSSVVDADFSLSGGFNPDAPPVAPAASFNRGGGFAAPLGCGTAATAATAAVLSTCSKPEPRSGQQYIRYRR